MVYKKIRQSRNTICKYQPGMFIDVDCKASKVYNYHSMQDLLTILKETYPNDIELISVGKSEGFGKPSNSLQIPAIHILSTGENRQTIFAAAGHHPEYSGPSTASLMAQRLLRSYYEGNLHVRNMRVETDVFIIPQINVDLYNNLSEWDSDNPDQYWEKAYGSVTFIYDGKSHTWAKRWDSNFYGHPNEHEIFYGYPPPRQSTTTKTAIDELAKKYGAPFLAFDYHESIHPHFIIIQQSPEEKPIKGYTDFRVAGIDPKDTEGILTACENGLVDDMHIHTLSLPKYALEEVEKSFPGKVDFDEEHIHTGRGYTFEEYLATKGAESFLFEANPTVDLHERVEMNLIATDRILARYFLGI